MPPLFITAVKDICVINTFRKLLNILFSDVYCFTFRLYNTIVFWNYNWCVSIWCIEFVSPLTTRISVFSSSPARRPWCSNSLVRHLLNDISCDSSWFSPDTGHRSSESCFSGSHLCMLTLLSIWTWKLPHQTFSHVRFTLLNHSTVGTWSHRLPFI